MLKIEKLIPGGQALATLENGKKVFVWNALPGEIIEGFEIVKNKSSYAEAIASNITAFSSDRITPKDAHYLSTSPWQIISFEAENKIKADLVVESFREEKIIIKTPTVFTDNKEYFYRNKMEYSLFWDKEEEKISLAVHARGSHRKIPIEKSSIERPEILACAKEIVNELNKRREEARKYQSLLLRCNQKGEVSGGLFENKKPHPTFNKLTDNILDHSYSYSPNGFFQINLPVYELALKEIKKHIRTDKVLDLYAGVGTIGLSVANDKNLTLVEVDRFAYGEMKNNIEQFKKDNIFGLLARSEDILNNIEPDQTVILDPPRAGCDKKLLEKLNEVIPEKIIYLSCNPSTQARDVKILLEQYQIEDIKTFNFFPHTPHIENLVILQRTHK